MKNQQQRWLYLGLLSIVWGSSFILMKKALISLAPIQLGALRIIITGLFLGVFSFTSLKNIQKKHRKYIVYSAVLGTFFPVFLFAYALQNIDSSISSILNSFTPFNTIIIGALIFGFTIKKQQFLGVLIGLAGSILLVLNGASHNPSQNYWFSLLIIIASVGYAFNVNIVKKHLSDLSATAITTGSFLLLLIPSSIILFFTNFFSTFQTTETALESLGYIAILAVVGTGIAKIIFNKLVHLSSPVFSSSVTYLIPIVAVFWGVLDNEKLTLTQLFAAIIILAGVYLVNKKNNL